ncbi:2-C-methyl-D-erythritol 2,4-cyclodiphosphate synthase [Idiomarina tyrosinivorans]|uniref:2-C-methyl-D-erythritol 2,4-cyclodiphosphate synthase n=1 Tax=Idiomarina tyrosinivorans TaxID=1445662 RepID=A0A432ZRZ7_9GAMM|nr:2-C-methyl-D-erythritol 2,4-cyclodiphosphate synthase [Idiomarina tyrosinivorans]RUO80608.1 2-C-methyl-D-erythritol 2,4-cyclodiphosphate synthase [Idiomarina tyrosinivorans]
MTLRIGHGFDVHRWEAKTKPLRIAGVELASERSLQAHSDGDVALHALADALLGALALGDIGQHFPDTDAQFAGADSRQLLQQVYRLIKQQGFHLLNADLTIMAQSPKMAPHILAMREAIADCLAVKVSQVSVKATTTEKLGFVGREEGIACEAVVLLQEHS